MQDGPAVLQEEVAGARGAVELHQQLDGPAGGPRPGLRRLVRSQLGLEGRRRRGESYQVSNVHLASSHSLKSQKVHSGWRFNSIKFRAPFRALIHARVCAQTSHAKVVGNVLMITIHSVPRFVLVSVLKFRSSHWAH